MANRIKTQAYVNVNQILFNTDPQVSVGALISNSGVDADDSGKKIVKAGTPMTGDLEARGTAFTVAETTDSGTKGVYTVQITTAAAVGDKITIEGETYECAAAEDVAGKKFAGANAAAQVTSLLKMVVCDDFVVAAVSGATDKIGFTQKVAETGNSPSASVTQTTDGTMAITSATVTSGSTGTVSSNAVGVLLHDVDVTAGSENGTVLIFGFVDLNKIDSTALNKIDSAAKAALKHGVTFLK